MVGRMEVEADDVADLLGEEGIGGELEVLLPVGLDMERGPEALDRGLGHPGGLGHGTAGPVRAAVGGTGLASVLCNSVMTVSSGMVRGLPGRCSS